MSPPLVALHDALSVLAPMDPADLDRPALIAGDLVWTFEDVAHRVMDLAHRFHDRGIVPGSRVALRADATPETFLAIHALSALGATLVPIHPRLSAAEVRVLVDVTRPDHVLEAADLSLDPHTAAAPAPLSLERHQQGSNASLSEGLSTIALVPSLIRGTAPAALENGPLPSPAEPAIWEGRTREARPGVGIRSASSSIAAPFAIVSTSGTTGRPKGAVLSRRAFVAAAEASAKNLGWEPDDRWLLCMPLAHVGGLSILTRCLLARRTVVMLPRFDPALVLDAIVRHRVTLLSVVPTMLRALLEADRDGALELPRAVLLGGAAAPPALLDDCAGRRVHALTTYGLTEACSQVTSQPPRDPSLRLDGSGPPLAGFEVRIVADPARPEPLPPGVAGRILVRGEALFDGYLQPDGSIEPAPASVGSGGRRSAPAQDPAFFDTGDIGELDERGHLHVHVRRTDLIVTGGENVYPAEVEQAIERLPSVRRAVVFGVADDRWGQIVAAVIEPLLSATPDPKHLVDLLSTTLAPHKRPRKWAVVEQLPLTPSGKIDRSNLEVRYRARLIPIR